MARAKVIFSSNRLLGDIKLRTSSNVGPNFSSTNTYIFRLGSKLPSKKEGHPFIGEVDRILYAFLSVSYASL